jgi:hypothetical protein
MANIKNNNYRKIDCRLRNDEYMDFMLAKTDSIKDNMLVDTDLAAKLDFFKHSNKYVVSNVAWDKSIASDSVLDNIGYTGVDNGFISYERDRIGNDEFLELYMNSTLDLSAHQDKFFVTEVNGNNNMFVYPIEITDEYTALKGGFYQGFFKIDGDKYQTLPHQIKDEWNFNITLRKRNYETPSNILNKRHTNNKGLFFFIGTRAENKFWELYKMNPEMKQLKYDDSNDYNVDYNIIDSKVTEHQYIMNEPDTESKVTDYGVSCNCSDYFAEDNDPYSETGSKTECNNEYFDDAEYITYACDCPENKLAIDDEYLQEQISLKDLKLLDSKGYPLGEKGFFEIETDNKFIIFNNGKNGFDKNTWKDHYKFVLTGKKDCPNINYFPYLNHTKDGYDKNNIQVLIDEHSYSYNVFNDIKNNALGFKINDDGSITYRYAISGDEITEETSQAGLIQDDEWANIHIKIIRKGTNKEISCSDNYRPINMQIYIYVNGYLKFISKELPELTLKPLDDAPERQEGVPYNISIGGGTQGLIERVLLDYYNITDYELPLEKNFCGSFIGDIKNFTFIPHPICYSTIYQKRNGF